MIKIENLSYRYPSEEGNEGHLAIDGLNLAINKGDFVAILGHNGSGKSTLGKLINAQIFPSAGDIWLDDLNLSLIHISEPTRPSHISRMPSSA